MSSVFHHSTPLQFCAITLILLAHPVLSRLLALLFTLFLIKSRVRQVTGTTASATSVDMASRQLISPSRSGSTTPSDVSFRLQPPPHQYNREKRRGRILGPRSVEAVDGSEGAHLSSFKESLQGKAWRKWANTGSEPLLGRRDLEETEDEASTVMGDDADSQERPKRLMRGDIRLVYAGGENDRDENSGQEHHGSVLTSPVKSDVRNSAFFCDKHRLSPKETTDEATTASENSLSSSSTSSFVAVARSTFGLGFRRRGSQQSVRSPVQAEGGGEEDHTVVLLSPLSPLSPKQSAALHTPSYLHFEGVNTRLIVPSRKSDLEPLSATLKRLGAARKSGQIVESEEAEENEDSQGVQCLTPEWEHRLAERLDSHKRAAIARRANQEAVQQSAGLFTLRKTDSKHKSWLNIDLRQRQPGVLSRPKTYARIQSTTRGGARNSVQSAFARVSTIWASYIFGNAQGGQTRVSDTTRLNDGDIPMVEMDEGSLARPDPAAPCRKFKSDGWGGLRPRTSWFPDFMLGPLASPAPSSASRHLRPLHLRSGPKSGTYGEEEWEDEEEGPEVEEQEDPCHKAQDRPIRALRVRFPSYLPKPQRNVAASSTSATDSSAEDGIFVRYTSRSVEGRPLHRFHPFRLLRSHGGLLLAFVILIAMTAALAAIATSAIKHHATST